MSKAREFWAVRNVRTDSYEMLTIKPKWEEIPLGDERIHLIEYQAYKTAIEALKKTPCNCIITPVEDFICLRCETLKELGENE